jgi:hypothetical protein
MKHVHFFQYNIPADNHFCGQTDRYIDVKGTWDTDSFFDDGRPVTYFSLVNPTIHDCLQVKDWFKAYNDLTAIVQNHFEVLAREERINRARAELIAAGELQDNPILARYEADLLTQETLS